MSQTDHGSHKRPRAEGILRGQQPSSVRATLAHSSSDSPLQEAPPADSAEAAEPWAAGDHLGRGTSGGPAHGWALTSSTLPP